MCFLLSIQRTYMLRRDLATCVYDYFNTLVLSYVCTCVCVYVCVRERVYCVVLMPCYADAVFVRS